MSYALRNVNEYYEIEFFGDLDQMCQCLVTAHSRNLKRCITINGKVLYSDMTVDEMYIEAIGITKRQYDLIRLKTSAITKLGDPQVIEDVENDIQHYLSLGASLFSDDKLPLWEWMVRSSVSNDTYRSYELQCIIDLVALKDDWISANEAFQQQNHSGWGAALVVTMLRDLLQGDYPKIDEFVYYIYA